MSSPFLAEIRIFAGNFPPKGWATCDGQILAISQNTALFSLLGTQYGGNGTSNFALPNFQATAAVSQGQGPGLSQYSVGETAGVSGVTLLTNQLPQHTHTFNAGSGGRGNVTTVTGNFNGDAPFQSNIYGAATDGSVMNASMLGGAGSSQPHENMQPYQVLTFIIALQGIFPSRG